MLRRVLRCGRADLGPARCGTSARTLPPPRPGAIRADRLARQKESHRCPRPPPPAPPDESAARLAPGYATGEATPAGLDSPRAVEQGPRGHHLVLDRQDPVHH